ncbi:MAG: hypothetical protein E6Q67_04920 [Roseateles sp.]|nr:MAG: hypothetical protein E6Q67_04920 [Roseateles sp.]
MSNYGFRFVNDSGIVSVDEDTRAYVYLGKYGPFGANGVTDYTVDITCAGFPIIFFSVPSITAGDGGVAGNEPWIRSGVYLRKLTYLGGNSWRVTMSGFNASTTVNGAFVSLATTLRVFGRLDLNFPGGAPGGGYGMRVWNSGGALVFDSNARMLKLAGNTYDVELQLKKYYPGYSTGDPAADYAAWDTAVTMPWSMAGKSIQATSRGMLHHLQLSGSYYDPGSGLTVYQYTVYDWATGYWSTGSTLVARKLYVGSSVQEFAGPTSVVTSGLADVYTRLAVIDNSQFP